jgi:hypothetical protein
MVVMVDMEVMVVTVVTVVMVVMVDMEVMVVTVVTVVMVVMVDMEVIMVTEININNTTQFTGVRYACIVDSTG